MVKECVVTARTIDGKGKQLVAYYITKPDPTCPNPANAQPSVSKPELRAYLEDQLPSFLVPSHLVPLAAFPLTPNGKLDRNALPPPPLESSAEYVAPTSPIEIALADIWRDVLKVDKIGIRANFFELGGDSVDSIQIVVRAHKRGLQLTSALVQRYPTIEELAAQVGISTSTVIQPSTIPGIIAPSPKLAREASSASLAALISGEPGLLRSVTPSLTSPSPALSSSTLSIVPTPFALAANIPLEVRQKLQTDPDVEDIYPLTPLQEGLLFHTLLDPQQYLTQIQWKMRGSSY